MTRLVDAETILRDKLVQAVGLGLEHAAQYLEKVATADEKHMPEISRELRRHANNIRAMKGTPR